MAAANNCPSSCAPWAGRHRRCGPCPPFLMSFRLGTTEIPLLLPSTHTCPSKAVEMMSQEVNRTTRRLSLKNFLPSRPGHFIQSGKQDTKA